METIFIQIASYKDPELINTIEDCLQKSSFPERLRFGICWQKTENEKISPYDGDGRFRIHAVDWRESRGVGWARNICNGLWQSEDFTLQIDSHHRFAEGWDVTLIDQWRQCSHPKAVLSGYPPRFEYLEDGKIFFAKLSPRTMIVKEFYAGFVPIFKSGVIPDSNKINSPYKGCFISAGFLFTIGKVCEEVPYNKEVYFSGEEILHSLRLFTHGYRVFHPHKWVTWHLYARLTGEKHWSDYANDCEMNVKLKEIRATSMDVLKQTLTGGIKYPGLLGTTNTLEDFENYCGIKFKSLVLHPKMMAGEQPPFESANGWEDSVSPLKEWYSNFDIHTEDVPECDDYDFWYFALHDRNCCELHRDDIRNKGGMVSKEAIRTYTKKVFLREKPEKYIIWPHSASKGWIKRLVYDIPENGVTLTSETIPCQTDQKQTATQSPADVKGFQDGKFNTHADSDDGIAGLTAITSPVPVQRPAQGDVKSEVRELQVRNKRLYVNGSHFPQWWNSVAEGKWEPETFLVLESLIEPGSTYIDVGAWIGATVLFAADQAGRTIVFEPDPCILPLLKENIALNPCIASRIMLYEAALSTFDGKAALFNNRPGNSGSSLLRTFGYTKEVVQKQFAETVVMDAHPFLAGLDLANVSLIKIDIEGGEYDLVPHIAPLLMRHRPTLYLSLHPFNIASDLPQEKKDEQIAARTMKLLESLSCYRHVYLPAHGNIGASPSDVPGLLEMVRRTGTLTGSIIVSDRLVPLARNGK